MTGGRVELTELLQRAGLEIMGDWQTEDVLPFEDVLAVHARDAACAVRDSTTPPVLRGTGGVQCIAEIQPRSCSYADSVRKSS
ncbi:hypothetical protein QFZ67_001545 [Streptomyces sp. V1I1]|nr:hypothetical protein [Streptomyces sp. V1I1]